MGTVIVTTVGALALAVMAAPLTTLGASATGRLTSRIPMPEGVLLVHVSVGSRPRLLVASRRGRLPLLVQTELAYFVSEGDMLLALASRHDVGASTLLKMAQRCWSHEVREAIAANPLATPDMYVAPLRNSQIPSDDGMGRWHRMTADAEMARPCAGSS